ETMAAGKAARAAADEAERELKRAQGVASDAAAQTARAESGHQAAVSGGNRLPASLAAALAGPLAESGTGASLAATRKLAGTRLALESPAEKDSAEVTQAKVTRADVTRAEVTRADLTRAEAARAEVAAVLKDAERVERESERAAQAANAARTRHRR